MARRVEVDNLLSSAEVAELLGLSHRESVNTYARRYEDFPDPIVDKSGGRIRLWLRQDIETWFDGRVGA